MYSDTDVMDLTPSTRETAITIQESIEKLLQSPKRIPLHVKHQFGIDAKIQEEFDEPIENHHCMTFSDRIQITRKFNSMATPQHNQGWWLNREPARHTERLKSQRIPPPPTEAPPPPPGLTRESPRATLNEYILSRTDEESLAGSSVDCFSPKKVQSIYSKDSDTRASDTLTRGSPHYLTSSDSVVVDSEDWSHGSPDSPGNKVCLNLECLVAAPESKDAITTFMLRNIPNKYTRSMMLNELAERGFEGLYDFFYLPIDFRHRCNVGYAFLNLTSREVAQEFISAFNGRKLKRVKSTKVCLVAPAKLQGQMSNADQYRNSAVMNMQEKYHPLFFKDGKQIPFPPPTSAFGTGFRHTNSNVYQRGSENGCGMSEGALEDATGKLFKPIAG